MIPFRIATHCRISGESLEQALPLLERESSPIPGLYPDDPDLSAGLRAPLRVVQAPGSGLVQLGHHFDDSLYADYSFRGGHSAGYRAYLETFAGRVAERFSPATPILEVGCGDGSLLRALRERGFTRLCGLDPSRAAEDPALPAVHRGRFPEDLPEGWRGPAAALIVLRHVLEHIEAPVPFLEALRRHLAPGGQLWIEVPDLQSTLQQDLWSNFYQLHCSYFCATTLDRAAAQADLRFLDGEIAPIFGGSLLRRYAIGPAIDPAPPPRWSGWADRLASYLAGLRRLASDLPPGSVGYGAAERTAAMIGWVPEFQDRLLVLHDGNPLLAGRFLGGTRLLIRDPRTLFTHPPPAIVLFAISHVDELLQQWRDRLPPDTLIGLADGRGRLLPLRAY